MKKSFRSILLGSAFVFSLSMCLTSCEDILGEWSKPVPVDQTSAKTAGEISYASATLKKATKDPAFIYDLTNTGDGKVTYSSSDTGVATIDPNTGEVTPVGAGTTTITATVSDSESYTYAVKAQSYDLTLVAGYSYLKWNGTDALVEDIIADGAYTEVTSSSIPASWTAGTPSIAAGTYVINDNITIDNGVWGKIEIGGDVNLIIVDGKELIINDQIKDATLNTYKLNIYGQSSQTGKLTSSIPSSDLGVYNFRELAELNIHSAQVVATYAGNMGPAMLSITKLNVYAGSLIAEGSGSGTEYGVKFGSEFNIYGGKVTVIGRGDYAIEGDAGAVISVNGGEFYVGNPISTKKAINVTLNFASGLTGKAGAYADGWETDASWGTSIATGYTGTDQCVKVTP